MYLQPPVLHKRGLDSILGIYMEQEELFYDDNWNLELEDEVSTPSSNSLVIYSRDWTVETVLSQITLGNIDLNPKFQRRNAWNDSRKSKLIESLILGVPIPEIVLAEDPKKKKSFIVIDGKQRLLTLAGFFYPDKYDSWKVSKLNKLNSRSDLNGFTGKDILDNPDYKREIYNADIRCTVISNYENNGVLYDIFYRLNTGSVPLSSQELRQVLNKGAFADYLITTTNQILPIHKVLALTEPDSRLRDAEIILRYISFKIRGKFFKGNLSNFLDESMGIINEDWEFYKEDIIKIVDGFNNTTEFLLSELGAKKVGRKYSNNSWEPRFNRVLYEVEVYYFSLLDDVEKQKIKDAKNLEKKLESFMNNNIPFLETIESSTKSVERYKKRFSDFKSFVNHEYQLNINDSPF